MLVATMYGLKPVPFNRCPRPLVLVAWMYGLKPVPFNRSPICIYTKVKSKRMPRRNDIQKILVIGSGPIIIGQSAEFDYSGTQACKALKQEGYEVVLVNSNPATIMTDPELADRTYIEPLNHDYVEEIIRIEAEMLSSKPDAGKFALLPTVGGQTALNLAVDLADTGVLERYNVELIGAKL